MITDRFKISIWFRFVAAGTFLGLLASCATPQPGGRPQDVAAARSLREARSLHLSFEARAADYLQAAALTAPELGSGKEATPARETYNAAAAELTILLRSGETGRLWDHPLTLSANNTTYHLRLAPATDEVWSPDYFTSFESAATVKEKLIKKENLQDGVGGAWECEVSLHAKTSRLSRESPHPLRPRSTLKGATPL
jgi:hypothetical protein